MPSELLHIPPAYTLVGIYRLLTDPFIRQPVLDKIKHASVRGLIIGLVYAAGSWKILDWIVRRILLGRGGWLLGYGGTRAKVGDAVKESVGGVVKVGLRRLSFNIDLVLCRSISNSHPDSCYLTMTDTVLTSAQTPTFSSSSHKSRPSSACSYTKIYGSPDQELGL